jgi:hypothetical protein
MACSWSYEGKDYVNDADGGDDDDNERLPS